MQVLAVFACAYLLASCLLVTVVSNALKNELVAQVQTESLLLEEIYKTHGRAGLIETLHDLNRNYTTPSRTTGLFDASGVSLAGPISVAPDFVGVERKQVSTLSKGEIEGRYFLYVRKIEELTLVVGRDGRPVDVARTRLVGGLAVFGLLVGAVIFALGLWASRKSYFRLAEMETALRRISKGEMAARLPVTLAGDQFDRVSVQMNGNLDQLARLMAGMKATASAIAHDLKTPLSHVQMAMIEAADACEVGQDPAPKINAALRAAETLDGVFETVLRIARIQASREQSNFGPVDLKHVGADTIEFLTPMAEDLQQSLVLESEGRPVVSGDLGMMRQATVNLVKNAVIYAGRGACITIHVAPDRLTVRDNGPGVDADPATLIDPFVRGDEARSTTGSGLGLALVKAVADHHGATLSLRNLDPGFEVRLDFPNYKKN